MLEPYEARVSRTVLRGEGSRKGSFLPDHPGDSPEPSSTDEATFARCFGPADWSLMFIVARGGQTYARLRFRAGPGAELLLPVEITYEHSFAGSNASAWYEEYQRCVQPIISFQAIVPPCWPDQSKLMRLTQDEWDELEAYHNPELIHDYAGY